MGLRRHIRIAPSLPPHETPRLVAFCDHSKIPLAYFAVVEDIAKRVLASTNWRLVMIRFHEVLEWYIPEDLCRLVLTDLAGVCPATMSYHAAVGVYGLSVVEASPLYLFDHRVANRGVLRARIYFSRLLSVMRGRIVSKRAHT